MKSSQIVFVTVGVALISFFAGCASLQKPSQETFATLSVVTYGELTPKDKDYILYFPAGKPIPTKVSVKGTVFDQEAEETLEVTLKKDIYTHKNWASFDKVNWVEGDDLIDFHLDIKVPGYEHPKPGVISVEMNEK